MRTLFLATCILVGLVAKSQNSNYKVVFDMTSKDSTNQQSLIRQLTFIRQANPAAMMEVVIYGQGLDLVKKEGTQQQAVSGLLADKNISFKVCAITMQRHKVDKTQLLPGVQVVADGIYEIISKQQEGWGYIKVAN
jgi:uncharacterized protein